MFKVVVQCLVVFKDTVCFFAFWRLHFYLILTPPFLGAAFFAGLFFGEAPTFLAAAFGAIFFTGADFAFGEAFTGVAFTAFTTFAGAAFFTGAFFFGARS